MRWEVAQLARRLGRDKPLGDVAILWLARIVSSFATVAVLAAAARHLLVDEFAEFALLVGLVAWLPVLDFGFGSVMQNRLAEQRARGQQAPQVIAACLVAACVIAVVAALAGAVFLAAWQHLATSRLMQQSSAVFLTLGCLAISGLSMIVHKVLAATGRLKLSALLSAAQNLLALGGLVLAFDLAGPAPRLVWPLLGYFLPFTTVPVLAVAQVAAASGWFGALRGLDVLGTLRQAHLLRDAMQFWFVLVLSLVVIQFDQFLAFTYLTAKDFGHYTVACKLINFAYFPFSALLVANWSRVSTAHAHGDKPRVLSIVHSSIWIGIGYLTAMLLIFWATAGSISRFLPRGSGEIELGVLLGVGLVAINKVWTESFALVYMATSHVSVIATYLPVQAGVALVLQFLLVQLWGAYGLMLGGALSYFATSHWILACRTDRVFSSYASAQRA